MGFIKNRIDVECKKHKKLDWSRIAEAKIISEIKFLIDETLEERSFKDGGLGVYFARRLKERFTLNKE